MKRLLMLLFLNIGLSTSLFAQEFHGVPLIDNAQEFARFEPEKNRPGVVNYFTSMSLSDTLKFYISQLGEPNLKSKEYGRLKMTYMNIKQHKVIIVLSTQNRATQVDIMVQPETSDAS